MLQNQMEKAPSQRLHEIVAAIPAGEVSSTARRCGLNVRYLMKMRGEVVNVGIDTFAKLCAGMGRSADDLLGLSPPDPSRASESALRAAEADAARAHKRIERALQLLQGPDASAPSKRQPTPRPGKAGLP